MKIQNLILFSLIMYLNSLSLNGQSNLALRELEEKWKNSMDYTMKIAELMPDSLYGFKPTDEEMSFGEQLLHMGQNMTWLSQVYMMNDTTFKKENKEQLFLALDIKKEIEDAYALAMIAHKEMDINRLNDKMDFFAGPKTVRQIIHLMHDHATHHRGQLIVYLRLKGIKPPKYRGW
jgi:uncharacterized damage-inducible protein DinB